MTWSPSQYGKFEDERNRPIEDLLARLPKTEIETAADIGCGPGNSTQLLKAHYREATIIGMDSSADMIAAARTRLPDIQFEIADIAIWQNNGPFDVILSNAALQWVPDHAALLPRLISKLRAGGSLAVQMPDNLDEPAHRLMRDIAADGPWADKLAQASAAREPRHDAGWYYRLLHDEVARLNIWHTTYYHPLPGGAAAVVEWFKGSGLRPFLNPLDSDERARFIRRYQAAVGKACPSLPDGSVLLPFPRLFFIATR
jgi:trans-aconitate 2-methyltransferase